MHDKYDSSLVSVIQGNLVLEKRNNDFIITQHACLTSCLKMTLTLNLQAIL